MFNLQEFLCNVVLLFFKAWVHFQKFIWVFFCTSASFYLLFIFPLPSQTCRVYLQYLVSHPFLQILSSGSFLGQVLWCNLLVFMGHIFKHICTPGNLLSNSQALWILLVGISLYPFKHYLAFGGNAVWPWSEQFYHFRFVFNLF